MKKFIICFALLFLIGLAPLYAAPQLGISPCQISVQPADLSVSGTSANRHLSTCGETLIVFNNGSTDIRFRLGTGSTTTATLGDMLIPANSFVTLNVGSSGLFLAAISSGTSTLSFIQGTSE